MNALHQARKSIVRLAGKGSRWETRRNALEVLRKICKSVALCEERQIQHEIMKDEYDMAPFGRSMAGLARSMTIEERGKYKQEGLYSKLLELKTLYGDHSIEEIFDDLWENFEGKSEAGTGDDYDTSSGGEEQGDDDEEEDEEDEEDEEEDEEDDEDLSFDSCGVPRRSRYR